MELFLLFFQYLLTRPLKQLEKLASFREKLNLDYHTAEKESPVFHTKLPLPFTVLVGENERPAFLSQANYLSQTWSCSKIIATGKNHFNVIDDLENERSDLVNLLTKT